MCRKMDASFPTEERVKLFPRKKCFGPGYGWDTVTHKDIRLMLLNLGMSESDVSSMSDTQLVVTIETYMPSKEYLLSVLSYMDTLDEETKNAIDSYSNYGFSAINTSLRMSKGVISGRALLIHNAIVNAPRTEKPYVVFRLDNSDNHVVQPSYTNYGFLSTTLDWNMSVEESIQNKRHLTVLEVPIGIPCIYIASREKELLLDTNLTINILSKNTRADSKHNYKAIIG